MNRSRCITGIVVAQAAWALALIGMAVFLTVLARMVTADISSGLKLSALTLIVPGLLAAISWYGLWKGALWGWCLAFFTDSALMAILIYSMVDDGLRNIDWDMAAMTATSAILPVFLLTPVVRKFFWRSTPRQASDVVS